MEDTERVDSAFLTNQEDLEAHINFLPASFLYKKILLERWEW